MFAIVDGRLTRGGKPFVAVGVNYVSSRFGADFWRPENDVDEELAGDLASIADAGLNSIRVFLVWRDAEPLEGVLDAAVLQRLDHVIALADAHGLAVVVSVLTIWFNGELLDPSWRDGRDLFTDPTMRARAEALVAVVAEVLARHGNVLALDLGDEVPNVDPVTAATMSPGQVRRWVAGLAASARAAAPGVLVTMAGHAGDVLGRPFGSSAWTELDLAAVHAWPLWAPGAVESTRSSKASMTSAFLVSYARRWSVPFVDELGTYAVDEPTATGHLGASAASALANGAAGVLAWCWRDITATSAPYDLRPGERSAGLVRSDGTAKPRLAALAAVADAAHRFAGFVPDDPHIAVVVPDLREPARGSYLDVGAPAVPCLYAHLLATRAHLRAAIVDDRGRPGSVLVHPAATQLRLHDLDVARDHLDMGGTMYVSVADSLHGLPPPDIAGVEAVDFTMLHEGRTGVGWLGRRWPLQWPPEVRGVVVQTVEAAVLATFDDGTPAVTVNRVGAGRCIVSVVPIELLVDRPGAFAEAPWEQWYGAIASLAGVEHLVDCDDPDVEIVVGHLDGAAVAILVNHAAEPRSVSLTGPSGRVGQVSFDAKSWRIVEFAS